jgi:integrase-like protein
VTGERLGEKVVWQLIKPYAETAGVPGIAPHDLRRTCAKLCRAGGGELEQIQLLLGHASVQTTERYLGTRQDLVHGFVMTSCRVFSRKSVRYMNAGIRVANLISFSCTSLRLDLYPPATVALLEVGERQRGNLGAPQAAAQEHG